MVKENIIPFPCADEENEIRDRIVAELIAIDRYKLAFKDLSQFHTDSLSQNVLSRILSIVNPGTKVELLSLAAGTCKKLGNVGKIINIITNQIFELIPEITGSR